MRKKVAIVGSGCAGLGAAWALRNSKYDVHIFEKQPRLGGHTNTQTWKKDKQSVPVDTGFIVMNTATYPNFIRFLKEVEVDILPTEMTFGVSRDHGKFEWSGEARGIFAQRRNLFSLRHWRMIFDIIRFNQSALDLLADDSGSAVNVSIGEYLDKEGYSQGFRDDYLIPMTAAVWSTSPDKASLEFPAQILVRFMWNHHLLSTMAARPGWLTIPGGSQKYIDAIVESFKHSTNDLHNHTSCEVLRIVRPQEGGESTSVYWTTSKDGQMKSASYDHVILACHGDEVLPLLRGTNIIAPNGSVEVRPASVSDEETEILSTFQTTENTCYLHSDLSLMPKRRDVWTSWNYLINSTPSKLSHPAGVSLTYCMNILQHISEDTFGPVLVTMNPDHKPDPNLTQGKYIYRHPLYTIQAVRAQDRLESIQNSRGVSYCGAWIKYGFHEDGFSGGLKIAIDHLGATLPFEFKDSTYSRGHIPELNWKDHLLRVVLRIAVLWIKIIEAAFRLPGLAFVPSTASYIVLFFLDLCEHLGVLE